MSDYVVAAFAHDLAASGSVRVRVVTSPDAHLNLIPVELAARLMVELAERIERCGVTTAHITFPHEVPVATLLSLVGRRHAVTIEPVAEFPEDPTPLESELATQLVSGVLLRT